MDLSVSFHLFKSIQHTVAHLPTDAFIYIYTYMVFQLLSHKSYDTVKSFNEQETVLCMNVCFYVPKAISSDVYPLWWPSTVF